MSTWEREIPAGADYVTRQFLEENKNRIRLSPYDIPRAASFSYNAKKKEFQIEFEYPLTPEETTTERELDGISIEFGDNTGKLYSASASDVTEKQGFAEIESALGQAMDEYDTAQPQDKVPYLNFSLAKDFLASEEDAALGEPIS